MTLVTGGDEQLGLEGSEALRVCFKDEELGRFQLREDAEIEGVLFRLFNGHYRSPSFGWLCANQRILMERWVLFLRCGDGKGG